MPSPGPLLALPFLMSLRQYCEGKRMVVLKPSTSAYEAARALDENHVGAVVVQDAGRLVGIVTDRDLAVRVTGSQVDARQTPLVDVMTPAPATLSAENSEEEALELMRDRHVRRVPIHDGGGVMGMVTLDDLIVAGALDKNQAAEVVAAQLTEATDLKPAGPTHPVRETADDAKREARHAAHATQTLHRFAERVQADLDLDEPAQALLAFEIVAAGIARRLMPTEAQHFAAQLPSHLRDRLLDLPAGPDPGVTQASITEDLARELDLDPGKAARLFDKVAASLPDFVSPGELEDVMGQMPAGLKQAFGRTKS